MVTNSFFRNNNAEIDRIFRKFSGYPDITRTKMELWLNNFKDGDKNLALKVLDNIEYFDSSRIFSACQDILRQVSALEKGNLSKVYFCNFGSPAGSGAYMNPMFATANGMNNKKWKNHFVQMHELNSLTAKDDVSIVFLDDFVGSGNQSVYHWPNIIPIVTDNTKVYLGVVAAFEEGIENIRNNTDLNVLCYKRLNDRNKLFSPSNTNFTRTEKNTLERYCRIASPSNPHGYGDCQALVVLAYKTPNNTVPILTVSRKKWNPIFPRYLNDK